MITTIRRKLTTKLSPTQIRMALFALPQDEWEPAILGQQRFFLKLAGVEGSLDPSNLSTMRRRPRYRNEGYGDIFFRHGFVLYAITGTPDGGVYIDEYGRAIRVAEDISDELEVGIIGEDIDRARSMLNEFASSLEKAIKTTLDGRKTRHMEFGWEEVAPEKERLEKVVKSSGEAEVSFERANLDPSIVKGALALADPNVREFGILISEAVFLRQKEAMDRRGKKPAEVEQLLEILKENGIVNSEYLLECKRRGTRLSRFSNPEAVQDDKIGALVCASCGQQFRDELITEGYSLSSLGRDLLQKSHWMTVWVSHVLAQLGVPQESIVWNVSESGEEVDLIVEFLGQLWIFELKDREFGAGDAHPFNYRRVKYGANQAVIVTADKVSRDAKRVFEDLSKDDPYRRGVKIVYVEGLESAEEVLRKLISEAAMDYARQRLSVLNEVAGYDMDTVLKAKFPTE